MTFNLNPKELLIYLFLAIIFVLTVTLDTSIAPGIFLLMVLFGVTFIFVEKRYPAQKNLLWLLLIVFILRLCIVLFIHYFNFQPFSGGEGDYISYNKQAIQISQDLKQGFSFEKLTLGYYQQKNNVIGHYYPVIIGYLYFFTSPDMISGQLFNVWLAVITCLLIYFLTLEIGGSDRAGFFAGIIACLYPSYIFYGSLLLKDTIFAPIILCGILLGLKLLKNFRWWLFIVFYFVLIAATHFRFYIAYALIFSFILCWFAFSKKTIAKRMWMGILITILLGFIPGLSGYGYYGFDTIKQYINPNMVTFYREVAYNPSAQSKNTQQALSAAEQVLSSGGTGSSIAAGSIDIYNPLKSIWTILKSFVYVVLGPLPWQVKSLTQAFALLETIPWYFVLFFAVKGIIKLFKKESVALFLVIFSILVFGVLSLFLSNFGIVTRIRMPAFITLFCFAALALEEKISTIKWKIKR